MWDLIVSVPDHCLSFYFSPQYRHVLVIINHIFSRQIISKIQKLLIYFFYFYFIISSFLYSFQKGLGHNRPSFFYFDFIRAEKIMFYFT